jgi:PAS domain S-box-containing protein
MRLVENDSERFLDYSQAIIKVALFDSELSLSAYFHADHEMLRLLAQVFESNLEAVIIAGVEGRMLHVNKSVALITGFASEELIGTPLYNLLSEREPELYETLWTTVTGGGQWQGEIWQKRKGGEEYLARVNVSAVKDATEKVTHVIAEFSDITAFKRTQEALARRTEELANSNQELEQFAYVASHDLQEPLRMVASYTQLLARRYKDKLDQDANEFIHFAVDGATRMQALIIDLLTMSRVGTHGKQLAPCESAVALERALSNLRLAIDESGAMVTHDAMPKLTADISQLTQLFQNLIGNAIKFRGDTSPTVHVGAEKKSDEWLFSVRDNGIGIAPDFFDRIFVIFQRLHGKHEYPGTGIGLSVCKKIVERHGGKIWIESEPGKGTIFYFTLPVNHGERKHHGE